jgi:hypothetical protein
VGFACLTIVLMRLIKKLQLTKFNLHLWKKMSYSEKEFTMKTLIQIIINNLETISNQENFNKAAINNCQTITRLTEVNNIL